MTWCSFAFIVLLSWYIKTCEWALGVTGLRTVCPSEWNLIDGKCYYKQSTVKRYNLAVPACEELSPPARLFSPINFDEVLQVATLFPTTEDFHISTEYSDGDWHWSNGDIVNGTWCSSVTRTANYRIRVEYQGGSRCLNIEINGYGQFACEEVLIDLQFPNELYQSLTDAKVSTCIDHNELYGDRFQEAYTVNLTIFTKLDDGLVTAHFNQDVNCTERSTMVTLKRENCGGRTVNFCPTKTTELSDTCEYDCPCEHDRCIVTVFERRNVTDVQPGLLCEITYGNSTTT